MIFLQLFLGNPPILVHARWHQRSAKSDSVQVVAATECLKHGGKVGEMVKIGQTLSCIAILWASTATADRHCAPSSEQYYAARLVLLETVPDAEQAVEKALANLRSARTEAAICGCREIGEVLDGLQMQVSDPEMSPTTVTDTILAAQDAVDAAIAACH
jgi:hypothetical protein